jgi:hypothetical protein
MIVIISEKFTVKQLGKLQHPNIQKRNYDSQNFFYP